MTKNLTPKQMTMIQFIRKFWSEHSYAPTLAEIAEHFKISPVAAMNTLKLLEDKGITSRDKSPRSIKIIDPDFEPKTIYRHYKGGLYEIVHNAVFQSSKPDLDKMNIVVYKSVADNNVYARTSDEFFGKVTVDDKTVSRFIKIDPFSFINDVAKEI